MRETTAAYWRDRIWKTEFQGHRRDEAAGHDRRTNPITLDEELIPVTLGERVDRRAALMVGPPVAVEQCPRYREAVEREIRKRKREGQAGEAEDRF